jgi:hypothetical protein
MKACHIDGISQEVELLWYPGTIYCPDWNDEHVMFTNYREAITSWFRVAVHRCNPERRALKGKTCASDDDINDFFSQNIFTMQVAR